MRKLFVIVLAVAMLAAMTTQASGARRSIKVGDDYFVRKGDPPTVFVAKGTRVKWRWKGVEYHNVRVRKGPRKFHSRVKSSGTFARKMRKRGTYKIICDVHSAGMRMTLKVY
jgi:plastocyanin